MEGVSVVTPPLKIATTAAIHLFGAVPIVPHRQPQHRGDLLQGLSEPVPLPIR